MGEEMRVWMRAVEKVLRAELLCVSLLICGRGWEKRKEVLGVAFFLLFLHVVVVGCIVGIIERAGGDGVTKARGSQGASGRRGPARHGSDLERLAGSPGMVREGELAACDEDEDDEDNVWRDGQRRGVRRGGSRGEGERTWCGGRTGSGLLGSALDQSDRSGTLRPVPGTIFRPFFYSHFS